MRKNETQRIMDIRHLMCGFKGEVSHYASNFIVNLYSGGVHLVKAKDQ